MSRSLTLESTELFTIDKTDNGDSIPSEVKPFDRDQLIKHRQRCSDLQEIVICDVYSMGIAGHALALAGALRLVDHACESYDVFPGKNTGYVSTAIEEIPGDECYVELTVPMDHPSPSHRSRPNLRSSPSYLTGGWRSLCSG